MGLFCRRAQRVSRSPYRPLFPFKVELADDRHTFVGEPDREVTVDGFEPVLPDGTPLYLSDDGPVDERVFYFRVAGVGHHAAAVQSSAFAPVSEVFLMREPGNAADRNAIRVIGQDKGHAGYVPGRLAAIMAPMLDRLTTGAAAGLVPRTYGTARGRNAIEVLATVDRDVAAKASFEDDGQYADPL